MSAPTLSVDGTSLTVPVIPFRRYGYMLIGDDWDESTIAVMEIGADSLGSQEITHATHEENGGNELLVTTKAVQFLLTGTPNAPIEIRMGEITGK
jgi:hypothetical protein